MFLLTFDNPFWYYKIFFHPQMKLNLKENDCEYGSYLHVLQQQLQNDYHIILQQV